MTDERAPMPALDACLAPTGFVDAADPSIVACVEELRVAALPPAERAAALFRFVRDEIRYEFMAKLTPEEYRASYVLRERRGFCVQKAVLLCALSRAAGVPCALVMSDLVDHSLSPKIARALGTNVMFHHGLNAFHVGGRWLEADATLSPDVTSRKGYRVVDFDGTADARLPATTLAGTPHATYARIHGAYADLPFEQMLNAFVEAYRNADQPALAELGFRL